MHTRLALTEGTRVRITTEADLYLSTSNIIVNNGDEYEETRFSSNCR